MKKLIVLSALALMSTTNFTQVQHICGEVKNAQQASACFYNFGLNVLQSHEGDNTLYLSVGNEDFIKFYKGLNAGAAYTAKIVQKAKGFDYIGVALVHMDEHEIVYFGIRNGENPEVFEITSENMVDIDYISDTPLAEEYFKASTWFLGGTEQTVVGGHWDLEDDLVRD